MKLDLVAGIMLLLKLVLYQIDIGIRIKKSIAHVEAIWIHVLNELLLGIIFLQLLL